MGTAIRDTKSSTWHVIEHDMEAGDPHTITWCGVVMHGRYARRRVTERQPMADVDEGDRCTRLGCKGRW